MNKKELRSIISGRKREFNDKYFKAQSDILFSSLEENVIFKCAKTIMLYYSLPDEVNTHDFIEKWYIEKQILLPVVSGNDIRLKVYNGKNSMKKGTYNIYEPLGEEFIKLTSIDMIIVPGTAFDYNGNRLGRGKGYYDRFLKNLCNTFKIGVCFDFQLFPEIQTNEFDIPMDEIWTESGYISKKRYPI